MFKLEKTWSYLIRLYQTVSNWIKLDQTGSDWIRLDQISLNLIHIGQTCSNWIKLDQTCLIWIKMDEIGSNLIKDININVLGHGRVINSFGYDRAIHFRQIGHWTHWVTWTLGNLATVIIGKLMFWKTWQTLLSCKEFQACYIVNFWGIKSSWMRHELDPNFVMKKDKTHYHKITILLTYYGS